VKPHSLVDIVSRGVVRRIATDILGICGLVHPDIINKHRRRKLDILEIDASKVDRKPEVGNDVLPRPEPSARPRENMGRFTYHGFLRDWTRTDLSERIADQTTSHDGPNGFAVADPCDVTIVEATIVLTMRLGSNQYSARTPGHIQNHRHYNTPYPIHSSSDQ